MSFVIKIDRKCKGRPNGCMLAVDSNSGQVSFFSIFSGSGLLDVKNELGNITVKHAAVIDNKVKLKYFSFDMIQLTR